MVFGVEARQREVHVEGVHFEARQGCLVVFAPLSHHSEDRLRVEQGKKKKKKKQRGGGVV
jgi:hypothetical protein